MISKKISYSAMLCALIINTLSLNARSAPEIARELLAQADETEIPQILSSRADAIDTAGDKITAIPREHKIVSLWDTQGNGLRSLRNPDIIVNGALNNNGTKIIVTLDNNTAIIWNCQTGRQLITLDNLTAGQTVNPAFGSFARNPVFNTAGNRVAIILASGAIKIFDAATGELVITLNHDNANTVSFNVTDDKIVTSSDDHTAKIWNATTGTLLHTLQHAGAVEHASFNRLGDKIVTSSRDYTAKIWASATGVLLHTLQHPQQAVINNAVFSKVDNKVITASDDGTAKIWNSDTGDLINTLNHAETINPIAEEIAEIQNVPPAIQNPAIEADDDSDIDDTSSESSQEEIDIAVNSAVFSETGDLALTASADGTAKIWNVATGQLVHIFTDGSPLVSALFSASGNTVITLSDEDSAKIWKVPRERIIGQYFSNKKLPLDQQALLVGLATQKIALHGEEEGFLQATLNAMPLSVRRALESYYS